VPLQIGVLAAQAQVLSRRLAPYVKVDYVPEKELFIYYWRDLAALKFPDKMKHDRTDSEWPIYLQIVADERQLSVINVPGITNPATGQAVKMVVRSTSLNLERLFQETLQWQSYSLLFSIRATLLSDNKLGLFPQDLRLANVKPETGKQSYLKIRLFISHYVFIFVDFWSGRFLLHTSVDVIDQESLQQMEKKLNGDNSLIPTIVRELRNKAFLHHFSCIASAESLRVDPFPDLLKSLSDSEKGGDQYSFSPNTLYMRFRDACNFYLAMEIDEQDFSPKFYLIETRMPRESQTTREPQRQQDAIPDPGAFLQIVRVISLAEALPKDSLLQTTPFQAPLSLLSTPTSFPTPMASPFSLMSPLPVPSPTVLHEPEPTSAESVTKQEREKGTEANGKGKEKKWSSPPGTPPVPGGVKRKSGETADGETAEGKAVEGKRPRVTDSQHLAEHLMPYHSLVTSAVRNCRKMITSLVIRRIFENTKLISYKGEENGDILLDVFLQFKLPVTQCRLQLLEDFKWVFLLEEEKPLFNLLAPFIAASPSSRRLPSSNNSKQVEIPVASSVSYIPGRGWRCEYDRVSDDSGEGLIYDLRDVDRMGFMAKDIENVLSNTAQYGHLARFFQIRRFTPTHLSLRFDGGRKGLTICLLHQGGSFQILWSGFDCRPLELFFLFIVNARKGMAEFLEAVYRLCPSIQSIKSFLHTPSTDNYLLSNDFLLIPRDVAHFCLVYKNTLGVNIRILPHRFVHIEDAAIANTTSITPGVTSSRLQFLPLINFQAFYSEHLLPLVASKLISFHLPQDKGLITHDVLSEALNLLHRFMGALYLYRQAGALLKNEGFEDLKQEKSNKVVFTANKQSFSIDITNHIELGLHVRIERKQETTSLFAMPTKPQEKITELSDEESSVLLTFFHNHVATPPFYHAISHLLSILRILTLPLPILQEFIQLMKKENERSADREGTRLRWLLSSPPHFAAVPPAQPAVVHDRTTNVISFVMGFTWRGQVRVGIGLRYNYQDRIVTTWDGTETSSSISVLQQLLSPLPSNPPEGILAATIALLERQPLEKIFSIVGLEVSV